MFDDFFTRISTDGTSSAADTTNFPLETITSEAHGAALEQTSKTISHHIAVKQLAELFQCEPTVVFLRKIDYSYYNQRTWGFIYTRRDSD
jgi:hypothetical protein